MKKIYYEKVGRRYLPTAEYDSDFLDSFPKGNHLVMCYPGGSSRRFNIDPNYAAMIAAGRVAEETIARALVQASEVQYRDAKRQALTEEQREAWNNLIRVFGDSARSLTWPAARDIAEAGVRAMMEEAEQLLANPSVRRAWDRFQLVCELTKEHKDD